MNSEELFNEAIILAERVTKFRAKQIEWDYLSRKKTLELLLNDSLYPSNCDGQTRWNIASTHANLELKEDESELATYLDDEESYLMGIKARNEAVIAAGWADAFEDRRSFMRKIEETRQKELEGGDATNDNS